MSYFTLWITASLKLGFWGKPPWPGPAARKRGGGETRFRGLSLQWEGSCRFLPSLGYASPLSVYNVSLGFWSHVATTPLVFCCLSLSSVWLARPLVCGESSWEKPKLRYKNRREALKQRYATWHVAVQSLLCFSSRDGRQNVVLIQNKHVSNHLPRA